MSLNIGNCPRCGRVFAKGMKDVCPSCVKDIDQEYVDCLEYLRENKGASMHDVSEETGVSIKQITKFIREGRISLMDAPNLGIPCDLCGTLIREGTMCESCRTRFSKDVNRLNESQKREAEALKEAMRASYQIRDGKNK